MDPVEILARAYSLAVGLAVGGGALALVIWRDSWRWRQLAAAYADERTFEAPERRFSTLILHGRGVAFNSYRGIVTLQADRNGLLIRFRPLFLTIPFYKPLYIPFTDIQAVPRRWLLMAHAVELETAKVPGLKIVMWDSTAEWIDAQCGGRLGARSAAAPKGIAAGWPG
ncbi:MAG: hypothetical protein R3C08_09915 [Hyphomonas sp.]